MASDLTTRVHRAARQAGADAVGVTDASPLAEARGRLRSHLRMGTSGPLRFTYEDPETATDATLSFAWGRSLVSVGKSYIQDAPSPGDRGPVIARFATRDHYESVREIADAVTTVLEGSGYQAETLIDDNRMVDRAVAARSGAGWLGRNTMLLTPADGPWMLLGTVVTDARLATTAPMKRSCGTCVACLPACPTAALSDAGLDARRCIATWLQSSGSIPHWIRPAIGRRVYGCDDCLTACPPGLKSLDASRAKAETLSFPKLLALSDDELVERFHWWYIPRRDGRYLRRNLLIAAGNSEEHEAAPSIRAHLGHRSSMIRGVAAWALARNLGRTALPELVAVDELETDPETLEELRLAILMLVDIDGYREAVGSGPVQVSL